MRKLLSCLSIVIILSSLESEATVQPQWKFYLAFEDGTGARDTIWCIWDSTAHLSLPVDTIFGEGRISLNPNIFNVFVGNSNQDTTKTVAFPIGLIGLVAPVQAINFHYPIKVSWDSSLFSAVFPWPFATIDEARIDNDYFFFMNNDPLLQAFNMLLDNHAYAPSFSWFSQNQFPMYFHLARRDTSYTTISELKST